MFFDINSFRGLIILALLLLFFCLFFFVYNPERKKAFEEYGKLPFIKNSSKGGY